MMQAGRRLIIQRLPRLIMILQIPAKSHESLSDLHRKRLTMQTEKRISKKKTVNAHNVKRHRPMLG
jgi:hypothetical protein